MSVVASFEMQSTPLCDLTSVPTSEPTQRNLTADFCHWIINLPQLIMDRLRGARITRADADAG